MFYTQLFTSKRGPLAKIWLAAHWERKLTKAHVFECNLETTVRDILSPKMKIGLRTSGHLLLGVVRIYSKKAKYLLADCNEALVKIKMAFRPGLTDLPEEDLEATVRAITLVEDFTSFDVQLPHLSDIDVVDHFSLNQSRSEEITLKENFGNSFLTFGYFGEDLHSNALLDVSFQSFSQHNDTFGDEDKGCDLLDFLTNSSDHPELTDFIREEPQNANVENTLPEQQDSDTTEAAEAETPVNNQTTLLTNEAEAFALEPVPVTPNSERKRGKRRRKLVVDQNKQLSNRFIREQLRNYTDLLAPLDLAPPTAQLMLWKERGAADRLFVQPCSAVVASQINELFAQKVFQAHCRPGHEAVEEMRQEGREVQRDLSSLSTDVSVDASVNPERSLVTEPTHLDYTEDHYEDDSQLQPDEGTAELPLPELPSEDSLLVQPSFGTQDTQSTSLHTQPLLNSQDVAERRVNRQSQKLLRTLQQNHRCSSASTSTSTFSLQALCRGATRSQAATAFLCFLILSKQRALHLHQSAPYQDIVATPGPNFQQ